MQCTASAAALIWAWRQQRGNLTVTSVFPVLCSAPHAGCQVPRLRRGAACLQGELGGRSRVGGVTVPLPLPPSPPAAALRPVQLLSRSVVLPMLAKHCAPKQYSYLILI